MPKRTIHLDAHSHVIRHNGSYYRPVPSRLRFGDADRPIQEIKGGYIYDDAGRCLTVGSSPTSVEIGMKVPVTHVKYTPYTIVHAPGGNELWTTHGVSEVWIDGKRVTIPSHEQWNVGQVYEEPEERFR